LEKVAEYDRALKGNNRTIGIIANVASSVDTIEDLNVTIRGKEEKVGMVGKIDAIARSVDSLNSDRKWVARLIIEWVMMTLFGIIMIMMAQ